MTGIAPPTQTMSWEEFYVATDNANKLMDRVWYCIACSDPQVANQTVFWEHWYWKDEVEAAKELDDSSPKECSNHTVTISPEKEEDFPIWPVTFTKTSMKMYPAIDCKCFVIAPLGVDISPVAFPKDDSKSEFRVDYANVMGKDMYFIFALDPHISKADQAKEFDKLEKFAGIKKDWLHFVQWDPNYKVTEAGEPDINPKGCIIM